MKVSVIRELLDRRPFGPIRFTLADGRKLDVPHNEFLSIFPSGRAAIVDGGRDDRFTVIDLVMVTSADVIPQRGRRAKRSS